MKKLFFLCSIIALGSTKPNGYYHQEYSYKSSSSSFKNNELQHKNDDQGFYTKDGDLEGRLTPKVNSQSQHSEYRNPKLTGGYQAAGYSGAEGANYLAGSAGSLGASGLQHASAVDGYASSDRVLDLSNIYNTRGYNTRQDYGANKGFGTSQSTYGALNSGSYGGSSGKYGYTQGGSGYGYVQHGSSQATSGSYGTNANLNALMQRLQEDMTRQLQQAIYKQYQTSGYSTSVSNSQMNTDIRLLEDELRRNLTRQLQDSLRTQYGSNTYSVVQGRPQTVPEYSSQELAALTRRLEDDLISKLHQSVRTTYNRETSNIYTSSSNTYRPTVIYPASTSRPYYERPVITTPNIMRYSVAPSRDTVVSYPGSLVVQTPSNIRYTPIANPESLTQIASRTQSDINTYLDTALQNLYTTYLQTDRTSSYTITDFDNEVNRIKDEIIRKLTYNLEDEIRKNYGQQILKNDYYYSISSNGDISTQSNYNLRDYESLKKQVEENLLRKLNQTSNTYRNQYTQRQQSQYSSNSYTVTYRPTYYTSGNQLYNYSDLQKQLSLQLQNALNQHKYSQSSSYSSSASYNPQAYQTSLDELSRELQRNLTEQLSNYRAQASSSSSSSYGYMSGSSGGNADFESMKNQLQNQLMQQLRQGLQNQHHYSASASYSASSSSSANANYGMRQAYSSYPSTTCLHGCSMRRKRDLSHYNFDSGRRHGVKSVRRYFTPQGDRSDTVTSPRYLSYPHELSYPAHHSMEFSRQSSYSNHFQSTQSKTHTAKNEEAEPEIVEDLVLSNHGSHSTPKGDQQKTEQFEDGSLQELEPIARIYKKTLKYVDQNELEPQQSQHTISQRVQKIQDDLTQQLMLGQKTTQDILANTGKLSDQNDFTQQLELSHHHRLSTAGAEDQLLEDQNPMSQLKKINQYDLEAQLSLSPQSTEHRLEGNMMGHSHTSKHNDQELEGQLTLDQKPLGQQLENQNIIGHLHKPKHAYQEVEGQLTLDQQTLGQQIEDQNIIGHLDQTKHDDQELEGQLNLDHQTLGVKLENQNIIGHLQKPKFYSQELEGQLTIGPQLKDQNIVRQLSKPKRQELEAQLTLGQQLEDQNIIGHLYKPINQNFQEQQIGDDQNQQDLTQQLEMEDIHRPKLVREGQLEEHNTIGLTKPKVNRNSRQPLDDQNEEDLTQQLQLEDIRRPSLLKFNYQNKVSDSNRRFNSNVQQQTENDQNERDLTQQLVIEDTRKPDVEVQKLEETPTQQLELGNIQKSKVSDQQLQESDELTQQLELLGAPKNKTPYGDYEQQQTNGDEPTADQQLSDFSQQLELTHAQHEKPKVSSEQQLELEPVQKSQQQIEDDDLQQLELEGKPKNKFPKHAQATQQIEDDLAQQLEITNYKKPETDQQLQNQDDFNQNLELSRGPVQKPEAQEQKIVHSQLVLDAIPNQNDLTQQLEDAALVLTNPKRSTGIPDQQLTIEDQELETTEGYNHKPEQTVVDEELETPEQKLELSSETSSKRTNIRPHQPTVNQQVEEDLNQQLELTDPLDQVGRQSKLEVAKNPKHDLELTPNYVSPESELSFSPDTSDTSTSSGQSEQTFRHNTQYSSTGHKVVTQVSQTRHFPTQVFGSYGSTEQRPFTNGHSGHFSGTNYPGSASQTSIDSYENALKQQEALMDLLKRKVQESHSSNQDLYGQRIIKKTLLINGKAVDTQESSQLIKPNGEVLELQELKPVENTFPKNKYPVLDDYMPQHHVNTQSTGYSGNTLRSTYQLTGNPIEFLGKTQWFSGSKAFEKNPLSHFGTDFYRRGIQGNTQTELSGKSTRRVVHYVNGKPVSASEKIQILQPNGKLIERQHNLPTEELSSFSHGFSSGQFGQNTYGLNMPQSHINNQNSAVSRHTFKKTAHFVNGQLVDYSSGNQDLSPNERTAEFEGGLPHTELADNFSTTPFKHSTSNSHTSGIKSTRHYQSIGY